ncbi:MAG: hypothetical protein A2X28_01920 [Elusimicrobia bacterium GWA2_56_46]|nr:MAG: hypothetical protein A2X28_01920 [Elusimicrobia bacterium GWA2_56_46]OGR55472.1 MAG: hypothetical protein A2X39_01045 [Elusimicrobia bacterium GWC2_56_31]HBW21940.1 hypothetical protein [Elusimicrobiota bacterium]
MLTVKPDRPIEPNVLAVLKHLLAVTKALGVQYLMIGAKALDIQLHNVYGLPTYRPTNDTDFAVALENWGQFETLKDSLVKTGHFTPDNHKTQRVWYDRGVPVDLVPFGGLEEPYGTISWPPDSSQIMTVRGFAEINSAAEEIPIPESGSALRIAPLPGLAVLKIFAWNDRLETRDVWDIAALTQNYNLIVAEPRIFQDEQLSKSVGYDAVKAGAVLLGKDAAAIVNPSTLSAAQKILAVQIRRGNFVAQFASGLKSVDPDKQLSTAEELLRAFLIGFSK